jgi:hypothetical protein
MNTTPLWLTSCQFPSPFTLSGSTVLMLQNGNLMQTINPIQ